MSAIPSTPPAGLPARPSVQGATRAADAPGGYACLLALLEALILSLLVRLPGRQAAHLRRALLQRARALSAAYSPDTPNHVACATLGLIGDWILAGVRNRGMRCVAALRPHACARPSARAPPSTRPPSTPQTPSDRRAPHCASNSYE